MKRSASHYTHSRAGTVVILLFLSMFAFLMMVPMIYTICGAFKPNDELFLFPPSIFVKNPTMMNFSSLSALLQDSWVPLLRYIYNSAFVTVVGTVGNVLFASLAAYRIAKFDFPGRKLFFNRRTLQ